MTPPQAPAPAILLAHAGFVRALARAALRGDAECEDLEQDVWVAAIEGAPARQEEQRGWLAAVVRNRAVDLFRRRRRRVERERRAARAEAVAGPDEVVARAEVGRRLVAAALALEEPSRTAILLRFLDDLPPREVAARLGVPVETVRTRVKRGLERLRARLEDEWRAEDRDWRRAFAPLVAGGASGATVLSAIGGVLVAKKAMLAACLLLLLGGGTYVAVGVLDRGSEPSPSTQLAANPEEFAVEPSTSPQLRGRPAEERTAEAATGPEPLSAGTVLRGIVVDEEGAPIPGATVVEATVVSPSAGIDAPQGGDAGLVVPAVTDAEGRFELRHPHTTNRFALRARAPGHVLIGAGYPGNLVWADVGKEARIVLRRGIALRVRVTAAGDGHPLAGARVQTFAWQGWGLHGASPGDEALSGDDGWAEVVVAGESVDVVVEAPGRAEGVLWAQRVAPPATEVEVVLTTGGVVRGVIIDPEGRVVTGARITMLRGPRRRSTTTSDAQGRFEFTHVRAHVPTEDVEARRIVILACDAEGFGRQFMTSAPPADGGEVEVRFALVALQALEGRVRLKDGRPAAAIQVGYVPIEGNPKWGWTEWRGRRVATTDAAGMFRTEGLPPGPVAVWAPTDTRGAEPTATVVMPIQAPVELVLDTLPAQRPVRVLDAEGRPISGAEVRVICHEGGGARWEAYPPRTDAEGRALVTPSCAGAYTLAVDAPGAGPAFQAVEPGESTAALEIRLGAGRVEGRLLRLDGKPVRVRVALYGTVRGSSHGMAVTARQGAVDTDAEGRFRFARVSEGLHGLELMTEGFQLFDRGMNVQPDAGPIEQRVLTILEAVALTPVAEVVVEGQGNAAPDRIHVTAERQGGEGSVGFLWDPLAHVFRAMWPVAPGAWTMRASATGYESAETALTVRLDPPTERARLVLRPAR